MSPDLSFELLAFTSIVSFLLAGGLLGLWAATSRWHWFARAMVVVCLLALVQWRPLYELYLTLLTQVATIGVGVAIYRRRWPTWRFSIAGLLMLTVIMAVVLASLLREPEKEFTWQSGLMGVGFGAVGGSLSLLGAWLMATKRRWRWRLLVGAFAVVVLGYGWGLSDQLAHQFVEYDGDGGIFLPWSLGGTSLAIPTMPWLCSLVLAVVILTLTAVAWRRPRVALPLALLLAALPIYLVCSLSTPLPMPAVRPASTAYTRLMVLANSPPFAAIENRVWSRSVNKEDIPLLIRDAEPAYQDAWALMESPIEPGLDLNQWLRDEAGARVSLLRVWASRIMVYRTAGDPQKTADSCFWLWEFVEQIERPGAVTDRIINSAAEGMVSVETYKSLGMLRRDDCVTLARQIARINANRTPWEEIARCERIQYEHFRGWRGHWYFMLKGWTKSSENTSPGAGWSTGLGAATTSSLLATELALRAYHLDHATYPESLESLVPNYLPHIPVDPCSAEGERVVYRKTEEGYMLYSRGYDQDDDGGQSPTATLEWDPFNTIDWTADGDLSLEEFFKEE